MSIRLWYKYSSLGRNRLLYKFVRKRIKFLYDKPNSVCNVDTVKEIDLLYMALG